MSKSVLVESLSLADASLSAALAEAGLGARVDTDCCTRESRTVGTEGGESDVDVFAGLFFFKPPNFGLLLGCGLPRCRLEE